MIITNVYDEISQACEAGDVGLVEQMVASSSELTHKGRMEEWLAQAAYGGHLHIVRYLLHCDKLKEFINIHSDEDILLKGACTNGHLELVKYLTASDELGEHARSILLTIRSSALPAIMLICQ